MKIYVASSWRNEHQQHVVEALRNAGHDVYDFKHPIQGDSGFHWSEIDPYWQSWTTQQFWAALKHKYALFGFDRDFSAMKEADACVLVLPCGRSAHLEAGWMTGAGKKVLAYIPPHCRIEPELMYNMLDNVTSDMNEIVQLLSKAPGNDNSASVTITGGNHGNGAKMREVVVRISHMNDDGYYNGQYSITEIVDMAKAALAAPPRNCDRYTGEDLDRDVDDAYARADNDLMLDYDREDLPIRWLLSTTEQVEAYKKKFLEELKILGKAVRGEK